MLHNLVMLVDVLRTINDESVDLSSIRQLLKESLTLVQFKQIISCCNETAGVLPPLLDAQSIPVEHDRKYGLRSGQWIITAGEKKIQITRPMIQHGIKGSYKKLKDFSMISSIHQSLLHSFVSNQTNNRITVASIPPTVIINNDSAHNTTTFVYTQRVCLIESLMIKIFQYLTLKQLCMCRSVCQQWLYDASNRQSVYHIDSFELLQCIDSFIWMILDSDDPMRSEIETQCKITKYCTIYIESNDKYLTNVLKYNLNILQSCQSICINNKHFDRLVSGTAESRIMHDWLLMQVKKITIMINGRFKE